MTRDPITLAAVGDIFLQTKDGSNPFAYIQEGLRGYDLVFANLETPLTTEATPSREKSVLLRCDPCKAVYLRDANVSVVNLANNHMLDYGEQGIRETVLTLDKYGISCAGLAHGKRLHRTPLKIVNIKGTRIGISGAYCGGRNYYGSAWITCINLGDSDYVEYVKHKSQEVDFLVVSLHWGVENILYPSPKQQAFARQIIDAGADVIIGHHPHSLQGIEKWGNGVILYSLGNFNFKRFQKVNIEGDELHRKSVIATIRVIPDGTAALECIPIFINDNYQPYVCYESGIMELIERISFPLENKMKVMFWFGEVALPYLKGNGWSFWVRISKYGSYHAILMCRWLLRPFVWMCIVGIIVKNVRRIKQLIVEKVYGIRCMS